MNWNAQVPLNALVSPCHRKYSKGRVKNEQGLSAKKTALRNFALSPVYSLARQSHWGSRGKGQALHSKVTLRESNSLNYSRSKPRFFLSKAQIFLHALPKIPRSISNTAPLKSHEGGLLIQPHPANSALPVRSGRSRTLTWQWHTLRKRKWLKTISRHTYFSDISMALSCRKASMGCCHHTLWEVGANAK